jgi:SulP family sulfate permease
MHRLSETQSATIGDSLNSGADIDDRPRSAILDIKLPDAIRVFEFRGPLFFGASQRVGEALDSLKTWPRVLVLRMRDVPLIDATGISAFSDLLSACRRHGCRVVISGLQAQPRSALHRYELLRPNRVVLASNSYIALEKAKAMVEDADRPHHGAA